MSQSGSLVDRVPKWPALWAAMVVGAASLLVLGIEPILLGSLVDAGRLTDVELGEVATLETMCLAVGATVGPFWMARGAMPAKTVAAALALALVNLLTNHAPSPVWIMLERAAAGLLAGILLGASTLIVVNGRNPDRLSGIQLGTAYLPQIGAAYLLPVTLIPTFGAAAGFYILAAAAMAAALVGAVMSVQPDPVQAAATEAAGPAWRSPGLLLLAFAILVQYCSGGAAWNYVERVAYARGFEPETLGTIIAASLAMQVVAAWTLAWLSPRLPKWPMLLGLAAIQAAFVVVTIYANSPVLFGIAVCLFASMPPAMQPFQVVELINLDPSRRAAVLIGPVMLTGNALGPLAVSLAIPAGSAVVSLWMALMLMLASLSLYVLAALRSRAKAPGPAPISPG